MVTLNGENYSTRPASVVVHVECKISVDGACDFFFSSSSGLGLKNMVKTYYRAMYAHGDHRDPTTINIDQRLCADDESATICFIILYTPCVLVVRLLAVRSFDNVAHNIRYIITLRSGGRGMRIIRPVECPPRRRCRQRPGDSYVTLQQQTGENEPILFLWYSLQHARIIFFNIVLYFCIPINNNINNIIQTRVVM